jgi:polyisoprenyl-phosphate glycosyltransferase
MSPSSRTKSAWRSVKRAPIAPAPLGRLISVCIPVYNEENNVRRAYEAILAVSKSLQPKYRFEIVFTDNHSSDRTFSQLQEIAAKDKSVRVLRFARNFGVNKSILTGYRHARGDAAVQIDCDLQDPPTLIPEFIKKWEEGYDVVVGIRRKRDEGHFVELCRRVFYRLLSRVSDDPIVVDAGEFRLIDRQIVEQLRKIDDAYPFVRGLISALAHRQTGIAYDRAQRHHDRSKFPLYKLTSYAVSGLLGHTTLPLRIATYIGLFVALSALCLSGYYLSARLLNGDEWPSGFATTSILLLFSTSLNALFLGIIGEYVGRIYTQIRRRPTVVIETTINCDDSPGSKEEVGTVYESESHS